MQSILEIKTGLYRLLNVASVEAVIGGKVYRSMAPTGGTAENVEIISGGNANDFVQDATVFVNYHTKNLTDGQPNEAQHKAFSDVVLPLLEAEHGYQIIDDDTYPNNERPGWSIYSIRVRVFALNDNFVE